MAPSPTPASRDAAAASGTAASRDTDAASEPAAVSDAPASRDTAAASETVATIERGLSVLRLLAAARSGRTSRADLVRATGLARSSLDRVAATLCRLGHLRAEGQDLLLTPRVMEFGNAYLAAARIPSLAGPARRLAEELDESVSVSVPDGDGSRFVVRCPRSRAMAVAFRVGDLLPAERSASGPLFAAAWDTRDWERWRRRRAAGPATDAFPALPPVPGAGTGAADFAERAERARRTGAALDDQTVEPGVIAVSLPVHGPGGEVVCAVGVVSHTSRHTVDSLAEHALPRLRACVRDMAGALARPPEDDPGPAARAGDATARRLRAAKEELGPVFLQSLARGLAVLGVLRAPGGLSLARIAEATGLPRATARRALHSLAHLGYVATDATGRTFTPLPRVLELGYAAQSAVGFERLATPHLADLVRRIHDSSSIAVLDGDDIRYVARVATTRIMGVDLAVGTRLPAPVTAMGRVLLAGLPPAQAERRLARWSARTPGAPGRPDELRRTLDAAHRDGYAVSDEELEPGLRSIAVPLHDRSGRVVAAMNVAVHAAHRSVRDLRDNVLPRLAHTARRIEEDLAAATECTDAAAPV
ncbi:IclR family transcriptional regulator C-terminal domain-containing protein [Streptomyces sp. t39]|uniref:IclR family transcriptional regulator domain-containing protein n=1 Tax=Streptomyces sp. t39 TaxID=1828156 RepID=UPI0011CE0981|nr:IclR family transcriptional regulator C-terminal domain-containing protein [Streptomyces sp. t39]TXS57628.1 IclR family transcriptional regulator [Streptomyces sp. t39]